MQTALIIIASLVIGFLLLNVYARSMMKKIPKVADHAGTEVKRFVGVKQ